MSMRTVGVPPGTSTFMLPDGSVIQLVDWIDDKLYGSVELQNSDSTSVEAFSAGRSQQIPGGTRTQSKVDTNIPRSGDSGLPQSYEALIYAIGVDYTRAMRPDTSSTPTLGDTGAGLSDPVQFRTAWKIDRALYVDFNYNGKSYATGTSKDFPAGRGFWAAATASGFELVSNGNPSPQNRASMVLPIHMYANIGYKCSFQPEAALAISQTASDASTALTYADVRVSLHGLIKRPVI